MKKLFIFFLSLLLSQSTLVSAQDDGGGGSGPESGELLIEVTGSPFDGTSLLDFGTFRVRYTLSEALVPRIGIHMDLSNRQSTPDEVTDYSEYMVMPGIEYHFQQEGAFRSYAALDLIVGQRFASVESVTGTSVDGSTQIPSGNNDEFLEAGRAHFKAGANLAVGADYHFSSRFYIGVEIGLQVYKVINKEVTVDGQVYQASTTSNYGSINRTNAFKVGFKLF